MEVYIRQEAIEDRPRVFRLIEEAFKRETHSDHKEQFLVERLRSSDSFIPELSLVAEFDNKIIGYILLSRVKIITGAAHADSLALAPVAVLPAFHRKGIGTKLIQEAHLRATTLGFKSIVVLGHEKYYPRFGYKPSLDFKITLPFDAPRENCMICELEAGALRGLSGTVHYPKEFFE